MLFWFATRMGNSELSSIIFNFPMFLYFYRVLFNFRIVRWIPNWMFKNQFSSRWKVCRISSPVLFLSGAADSLIPPAMMTGSWQWLAFFRVTEKQFIKQGFFPSNFSYFCCQLWECNANSIVLAQYIPVCCGLSPSVWNCTLLNIFLLIIPVTNMYLVRNWAKLASDKALYTVINDVLWYELCTVKSNSVSHLFLELFRACGAEKKRLARFPDGTHNETWLCPQYYHTIAYFLEEVRSIQWTFRLSVFPLRK